LLGLQTLVCFSFGDYGEIDGDEDGFDTFGGDVVEEGFGFGAVFVDVELEEEGVGFWGLGDDFGEGEGCCGGDLILFNMSRCKRDAWWEEN
jgi:hypothetical protein